MNTGKAVSRENEGEVGVDQLIPAVKLEGSRAERLKTLDAAIARLERERSRLVGPSPKIPPGERESRYINAPVWPWFAAGWLLGALFVLLFLLAGVFA